MTALKQKIEREKNKPLSEKALDLTGEAVDAVESTGADVGIALKSGAKEMATSLGETAAKATIVTENVAGGIEDLAEGNLASKKEAVQIAKQQLQQETRAKKKEQISQKKTLSIADLPKGKVDAVGKLFMEKLDVIGALPENMDKNTPTQEFQKFLATKVQNKTDAYNLNHATVVGQTTINALKQYLQTEKKIRIV